MIKNIFFTLFLVVLAAGVAWVIIHPYKGKEIQWPVHKEEQHRYLIQEAHNRISFDLVDPEQAPEQDLSSIMHGYALVMNTPYYAPQYAKDQLSCNSCHFVGGDTLGGKGNGISLVGVTAVYPSYSERDGRMISLADRINNCFERSMSGNPLPKDSKEMQDILNYLGWISKEVVQAKEMPWLGLQRLKSHHQPNPQEGEKVYQTYCALCHNGDGQGSGSLLLGDEKVYPPVWGPNSFNDGAGMSKLLTLAAFVYWNMPRNSPGLLNESQSLDVAAFILQQPRPHFK